MIFEFFIYTILPILNMSAIPVYKILNLSSCMKDYDTIIEYAKDHVKLLALVTSMMFEIKWTIDDDIKAALPIGYRKTATHSSILTASSIVVNEIKKALVDKPDIIILVQKYIKIFISKYLATRECIYCKHKNIIMLSMCMKCNKDIWYYVPKIKCINKDTYAFRLIKSKMVVF